MSIIIQEILREELDGSLRMKKEYEAALKKLSKGCLTARVIGNHTYYYVAERVGKKVKFIYKGKISNSEKDRYELAKVLRGKYRKALTQVNKQIAFLKRALRLKTV